MKKFKKKTPNKFTPLIYLTLVGDLDVGVEEFKYRPRPKLVYKQYKVFYKKPKDNWVIVNDINPGKAVEQANYFMRKYYSKNEPLVVSAVFQE